VGIKESAARTLEYAYDDFCMAVFAKAAGRPQADVDKYLARAMNYKNLFDPGTGFMRGKKENGEWREPFDPAAWGGDFTEGGSWHYTWSVFQDVEGLIELMGGREAFIAKLDSVFTTPPDADYSAYGYKIHEITEMQAGGMGQYAHGNQPIQHAIYLYNYAGAPWKAQARVREVMAKLYTPYPNGYCGDEDNGQTSAWYVFSALGFYPVCPGTGQYILGSPLFEEAVMHLPGGKTFTITARGNGKDSPYIAGAKLSGENLTRAYLAHAEILAGGALEMRMSSTPNPAWGAAPRNSPFSLAGWPAEE
jgi:predicted alpha-1,2-mannosidase